MKQIEWKQCNHCDAAVSQDDGSIWADEKGYEHCGFCQYFVSDAEAYVAASTYDGNDK